MTTQVNEAGGIINPNQRLFQNKRWASEFLESHVRNGGLKAPMGQSGGLQRFRALDTFDRAANAEFNSIQFPVSISLRIPGAACQLCWSRCQRVTSAESCTAALARRSPDPILTTSMSCDSRRPIFTVMVSELLPTGRISRLYLLRRSSYSRLASGLAAATSHRAAATTAVKYRRPTHIAHQSRAAGASGKRQTQPASATARRSRAGTRQRHRTQSSQHRRDAVAASQPGSEPRPAMV